MVHSVDQLETLVSLYRTAFLIRHVELEIAREYSKGEMRCPVHLSVGQEITSAVFSIFQTNRDYAVSSHRAHAHYLAKGGDLQAMISEIFGKETGCSGGRGGSMHLSDPKVRFMGSSAIVGNSIPVGVGLAYGVKLRKENVNSFIFLGEGATEEGVFYESINFAAIHGLRAVFICENNRYSVYSGLESRQPANRNLSQVVSSMGVRSFSVPFADLEETVRVFSKCVDSLEAGPVYVEVETYRWLEHCGPNYDDNLNYRSEQELAKYRSYDLLSDIKLRILSSSKNLEAKIEFLENQITRQISEAFDFARSAPFPSKNSSLGEFHAN